MSIFLCVALYIAPGDATPIWSSCDDFTTDAQQELEESCNRDVDNCEIITEQFDGADPYTSYEWTILRHE